jgi:hypothetical protein
VTGKDVIGNKVSKTEAIIKAPMPLTLEQFIDSVQTNSLGKTVLDTGISATGIGVQEYTRR